MFTRLMKLITQNHSLSFSEPICDQPPKQELAARDDRCYGGDDQKDPGFGHNQTSPGSDP